MPDPAVRFNLQPLLHSLLMLLLCISLHAGLISMLFMVEIFAIAGRDVSGEIEVPQTYDDAAELLRQLMRGAMGQQSQPQSVIDILDQMELQHAPDFVLTAYLTALGDVVA